jgi:hypothetical protein
MQKILQIIIMPFVQTSAKTRPVSRPFYTLDTRNKKICKKKIQSKSNIFNRIIFFSEERTRKGRKKTWNGKEVVEINLHRKMVDVKCKT